MKVLVTGGAGFIGSHVSDAFVDAGHEVWALDDLSSGRRENLRPEVRLVVADIRSPEAARLVETERFEVMCHLAAQMDVRRSVTDPRFDAEVNIGGFLNLLEAARKSGVRKVVFSSTGGAIYGEQDVFPAPETHPTRPVSPYGVSKASGRAVPRLLPGAVRARPRSRSATPTSTARGRTRTARRGWWPSSPSGCSAGRPAPSTATGEQTRDFVYGPDVARANLLAARARRAGPDQHRHRRGDRREPALRAPGQGGGHGPPGAARPGQARRADAQLGGPVPRRRGSSAGVPRWRSRRGSSAPSAGSATDRRGRRSLRRRAGRRWRPGSPGC